MTPDQQALRDARNALSGLLLAAAFAAEPEVWPAFAAFVERQTGHDYNASPETMCVAIKIADRLRTELAQAIGTHPGTPYPGREP